MQFYVIFASTALLYGFIRKNRKNHMVQFMFDGEDDAKNAKRWKHDI